jgi:hypothetical protein
MKVFRKLELEGAKSALTKVIEIISDSLDNGWSRNIDKERWISAVASDKKYCFSCSKEEEREAAELWLAYPNDKTLTVTNIVPQETNRLSVDRYNLIIGEFYECFAKPVANTLGIAHTLTPATKPIEAWLSKEAATKLRKFSRFANKTTGSSQPNDRQRWIDFLVAAHSETKTISPDILTQWLIENQWYEDVAHDLSKEYALSHSLLTFYDGSQR